MSTDISILKKHKSIVICGVRYSLTFVPSSKMKKEHMSISYEDKEIQISDKLKYPSEALFHEIIHAIWAHNEIDNSIKRKSGTIREEILCNQIGLGVFLFIKDNIEFIYDLFGSKQENEHEE